uniref:Uncharacterized protein n=1 Tax=Graphocephala atropunctata TaxID=36148 RepID=A0A1B6MTH3_9HEMI
MLLCKLVLDKPFLDMLVPDTLVLDVPVPDVLLLDVLVLDALFLDVLVLGVLVLNALVPDVLLLDVLVLDALVLDVLLLDVPAQNMLLRTVYNTGHRRYPEQYSRDMGLRGLSSPQRRIRKPPGRTCWRGGQQRRDTLPGYRYTINSILYQWARSSPLPVNCVSVDYAPQDRLLVSVDKRV